MTASIHPITNPDDRATQAEFLKHLPRIQAHLKFAFRKITSGDVRADLKAETLALAWKHFRRLTQRGKRPEEFITTLAMRCTQAVRAGRRLTGMESNQDVLSRVAWAQRRISVIRFDDQVPPTDVLAEALAIDTRTHVPDQAAFRVDYPRWRSRFKPRDQAMLDALMRGERTSDAARQFGISLARVSQFRKKCAESWGNFHAGNPEPP